MRSWKHRDTRVRDFAALLAYAVLSALLTLLAIEGTLRLLGQGNPRDGRELSIAWSPPLLVHHPDPTISVILQPVSRGTQTYQRLLDRAVVKRVPFRISQQRFRGPDVSRWPASGVTRLLGVGDSITFGQGVSEEETYLSVAARSGRSEERLEVINAGVPSWSLSQEVRWIEEEGLKYRPSIITLGYYVNDLDPPLVLRAPVVRSPQSVARQAPRWTRTLRGRSYLANYLWRRYEATFVNRGYDGATYAENLRARYRDPATWSKARADLSRLSGLCRREGISCLVLLLPAFQSLPDDPLDDLRAQVGNEARAVGLEVLDLGPAVEGLNQARLWVLPGDPHPGAVAHRKMGEALAERLQTMRPESVSVAGPPR